MQASILDLLLELQERTGVGMLLITHDLGVARLMSDRIFVMKDGRFVESGGAEELMRNPQSAYTKKLLDAVPRLDGHHRQWEFRHERTVAVASRTSSSNIRSRAVCSARVDIRQLRRREGLDARGRRRIRLRQIDASPSRSCGC